MATAPRSASGDADLPRTTGAGEVGVGPWQGAWPTTADGEFDPRYEAQLLAHGDRRNVVDHYRYWAHDAIVAEATPNTEMTLIADLDLDLLKDLNTSGAVRNLRDRRKDLFSLSWSKKAAERDEELLAQGEERLPKTSRRRAIAAG